MKSIPDKELRKEIRTEDVMEKIADNCYCPFCGETDPRAMQRHHVAGRKNSDWTVPLCANCHFKISTEQYTDPAFKKGKRKAMMKGMALLLKESAKRLSELAK